MKIYKKLSAWWDDRYGGEWRAHTDFVIEPGDTFAEAFKQVFEQAGDDFFRKLGPSDRVRKVHVTMSISSGDDSILYGDVKAIL